MDQYAAGIDLGTTFASAAVFQNGKTWPVGLESRKSIETPSVIAPIGPMEHWLVGEAAQGAGVPLARRFKREIGTKTKLYIGDDEFTAEQLLSAQLRWVHHILETKLGGPPSSVTLTHPAAWGAFRQKRLQEVARTAGLTKVSLLDEPLAAATFFASQDSVRTGDVLAVYDLGGGTTDVTVMRKEAEQFVALGSSGIDQGSVDFDDTIIEILEDRLGGANPVDFEQLQNLASRAKITLSTDDYVKVPIQIADREVLIDLSAAELRAAVRPAVRSGVSHLDNALAHAGVKSSELSVILLAGGGSAMPLVGELITELIGMEPVMPPYPKMSVAFGAAIAAAATGNLIGADGSKTGVGARVASIEAPAAPPAQQQPVSTSRDGKGPPPLNLPDPAISRKPSRGGVPNGRGASAPPAQVPAAGFDPTSPNDPGTGPHVISIDTAIAVNTQGLRKGPPLVINTDPAYTPPALPQIFDPSGSPPAPPPNQPVKGGSVSAVDVAIVVAIIVLAVIAAVLLTYL